MLTLDILKPSQIEQNYSKSVESGGLPRLFAAAIVSREFRETLLQEPETAVQQGYLGQTFQLTDAEKRLLYSVRAESLTDLAQQVNRALKTR
jgi:hypothetical protein